MCGIAGCYLWQGTARRALLQDMARRLGHRGPDGSGIWCQGGVGLVHTRLAIIDLETGDQPLADGVTGSRLVANGEIYNHLELRRGLERRGARFATRSDCEPPLHAWRLDGPDALAALQGMYALALYDAPGRGLLLARDPLGIKPLFYLRRAEGLYFASEIKALLPLLGAPARLEPVALARCLQANFASGRQTLVHGIERVLPGEALWLQPDGRLQRWRHWTPFAVRPAHWDFTEAAERFEALLDEVLPQHLRADVPVGLFLSGGVDSSVLAALLRHYGQGPLATWSVGFEDAGVHDETAVAAAVARRLETDHHELHLARDRLLQRLVQATWAADECMGDYASLPVSLLAEAAGQQLKVVFSGEGGDEVFAGYGRYRTPRLRRRLRALRAPGSGGFRTRPLFRPARARSLFGPDLAEAARSWRDPFVAAWGAAPAAWSDLARMQWVDMATWLPDDLLVKADRQLMAWGVEGRVPFLDRRLVEFGLALPDRLKQEGRQGKWFLKRWAERHLPREMLWARKRGFTVPVKAWLRGAWLQRLGRVLAASPGIQAWFDTRALADLVQHQQRTGRDAAALWILLQFAIWHRLFIEGDGARPPGAVDPLDWLEETA